MRMWLVLAGLVTSVVPLSAQEAGPLEPLAFLAGSCWAGTFPDGKQTDIHCFEWMFGGKFIRDRHEVHHAPKPYSGETIFHWDHDANRIAYTYWNSDGGVESGSAQAEGGVLTFPSKYRSAQGELELRAVWTRQGNDGYLVEQYQRAGDTWKLLWRMAMTKQ